MTFPKLDDIKAGDWLKADRGFTCLKEDQVVLVHADEDGLFVPCADGRHYLDGQAGADGECVGLTRAECPHDMRWTVTVFHRSGCNLLAVAHAIEELGDLGEIIEGGPDWNTIDRIEIRLARVTTPGMTIETQDGGRA